jgi:hypothetical protein
MTARMLGVLALCAVFATSVNTAAHAGLLKVVKHTINADKKLLKATVYSEKQLINQRLTLRDHIQVQRLVAKSVVRCALLAPTIKSC